MAEEQKTDRLLYKVTRGNVTRKLPLTMLQRGDRLNLVAPPRGLVSYKEITPDGKLIVQEPSPQFHVPMLHRFPIANLKPDKFGNVIDTTYNRARADRPCSRNPDITGVSRDH
jgi:hypothetical protein